MIENASSMDTDARDEISALLGSIPYKADPSKQVPMSRPRFCWTNMDIGDVEGVTKEYKDGYIELHLEGQWPSPYVWLEEGCEQNDPTAIYPTCMKSIPRNQPPPQPAGLSRCDEATVQRWQSDWYRYPPYQYKPQYLIWDGSKRFSGY